MKLPFLYNAIVPVAKLTGYLLNLDHPKGASKAQFFYRFGFAIERPEKSADALLDVANENCVHSVGVGPHGVDYVIRGVLRSPDGRNPMIQTVWHIPHCKQIPSLATAYPVRGRQ